MSSPFPRLKTMIAVLLGNIPSAACRYSPTCSRYCREAVGRHGLVRGSYFCLSRILRCHPLSRRPFHDPVP